MRRAESASPSLAARFADLAGGPAGLLLFLSLVFAAYAPALPGAFIWDDMAVSHSPLVGAPGGVFDLWLRPWENSFEAHYWPLTYTTFWLETRLLPPSPGVYRSTNLILHAVNAWLLLRLLRRLGMRNALLAGLLFALHPARVQSVAWIIERKDVLSGLFALLSAEAFLRGLGPAGGRRAGAASLLFFGAGLLSKSSIIGLPFMLVLLGRAASPGTAWKTLIRRVLPHFTAAGLFGFADLLYSRGREILTLEDFGLAQRFAIAGRALALYAGKLAWPAPLAAIYPRWELPAGTALAFWILAPALMASVLVLLVPPGRRGGMLAALALFVIPLSPVLGFVDHGHMEISFAADRFAYLAAAAPFAMAAHGLPGPAWPGFRRSPAAARRFLPLLPAIATALAASVLGLATASQATLYRSSAAFWTRAVEIHPGSAKAWINYGNTRFDAGDAAGALECFERALGIKPGDAEALNNAATALALLGRAAEAVPRLEAALAARPNMPQSRYNLGNQFMALGRIEDAVREYGKAIELQEDFGPAHGNLAVALAKLGRLAEAIPHFERAAQISPGDERARANLEKARRDLAGGGPAR